MNKYIAFVWMLISRKRKATQNEDNYQHLGGKSKKVYQELKQNVTATTVAHSIKDKKEEIINLEELDIIPKAIITVKIITISSPSPLKLLQKLKMRNIQIKLKKKTK